MADQFEQHTIEYYFKQYGITDPDHKAKLLPLVTDVIYDRNMHVVNLEKEQDEAKRSQIVVGIEELEARLEKLFTQGDV